MDWAQNPESFKAKYLSQKIEVKYVIFSSNCQKISRSNQIQGVMGIGRLTIIDELMHKED